jgi:glucose 1-dehydrogenase
MTDTAKTPVAIVTGANRGVGKGVALMFAQEGYDIFLAHNGEADKAQVVANEIKKRFNRRCITYDCDLSQVEQIEALVKTAVDKFGTIDVLMSNAGVGYERYIRYAKIEEIDYVYQVNYRAGLLLARLVAEHMIENSIRGSILFTASIKSIQPTAIDSVYGGLKAALKRSAQSLAREFAPYGIRVNTISPGCIAVNPKGYEDKNYDNERRAIPIGRTGTGEDIGYTAVFLASEKAGFITGIDILVDGGASCGLNSSNKEEEYDGIHGRGTKIIN